MDSELTDSDRPEPLKRPIRMTLLPGHEWDAEYTADGRNFSYRDPNIGKAYTRAQKWAEGPTRPYYSDYADGVVGALAAALKDFDTLVFSMVAAGCTENEIRLLLGAPYLEDLMLRVVFGAVREPDNS